MATFDETSSFSTSLRAVFLRPQPSGWLLSSKFQLAFLLSSKEVLFGPPGTIFIVVRFAAKSTLIFSISILSHIRAVTQYRWVRPDYNPVYFSLTNSFGKVLNQLCLVGWGLRFLGNASHFFEFAVSGWRGQLLIRHNFKIISHNESTIKP